MRTIHHVSLKPESEDCTPEQAEKQHGYVEGFAASVRRMMKKDRLWGWCCVKCTVTVFFQNEGKNYSVIGEEYLGGCSYASEADFVLNSMYYDDMVRSCTKEAMGKLEKIVNASIKK